MKTNLFEMSGFVMLLWLSIYTYEGLALKRDSSLFDGGHTVGHVDSSSVREESGLAASRRHPGILYTHNDSGDRARIYALDETTGHLRATYDINHATSHDWEDIAVGPCTAHHTNFCIYIGDIGGNVHGAENIIYMVREPPSIRDRSLDILETLKFSWDEHNAETLMVDPKGEIFVISKVDGGSGKMYQLPNSAWDSDRRVHLSHGVQLPIHDSGRGPVAGDISPDGSEVLVKTLHHVFYWNVGHNANYLSALSHHPDEELPLKSERQGESVCWDSKGSGYYTISEGTSAALHYYRRRS